MDWKNSVSKESLLYSTEFICTFVKLNGIEEGKFFSRSRSSIRCAKEWGAVKSKKKKGKTRQKGKEGRRRARRRRTKKKNKRWFAKWRSTGGPTPWPLSLLSTTDRLERKWPEILDPFRFEEKKNLPNSHFQLFFDILGTVQSLVGVYNG